MNFFCKCLLRVSNAQNLFKTGKLGNPWGEFTCEAGNSLTQTRKLNYSGILGTYIST